MDCCMTSQSLKRHGVISVHSLRTSWASLESHLPSSVVVIHNSHPVRCSEPQYWQDHMDSVVQPVFCSAKRLFLFDTSTGRQRYEISISKVPRHPNQERDLRNVNILPQACAGDKRRGSRLGLRQSF